MVSRKKTPRGSAIGRTLEDRRAIGEELALERMQKKRRVDAERADRQIDADLRKMGSALKRAERDRKRAGMTWLSRKITPRSSRRTGTTRCPRIELMTGLVLKRPSNRGPDGMSTFHFGWTSRGLGDGRQRASHRFRTGETVRHLKYILRESARELGPENLVSNISTDPDEIAGVLAELEMIETCGRSNANVYISIVIALPHELTPEGRVSAIRKIFAVFDEEGLPFVAVPHAPDPNGDRNNYHVHGMASLRPFRKEADGRYSFATETSAELNDGQWIAYLRGHIATVLNEEMAAAGHERRFTPLSNRDRGMAPPSRGEAKRGPGHNAVVRKEAELVELRAERDLLVARSEAFERLQSAAIAVSAAIGTGHQRISRRIEDAVRSVVVTRQRNLVAGATARSVLINRLTGLVGALNAARTAQDDAIATGRPNETIAESQCSAAEPKTPSSSTDENARPGPQSTDRRSRPTGAVGEIRRTLQEDAGRHPSAAASEPPVPASSSAVDETAVVGHSQHDFDRLARSEMERADEERRARRASLDRVLADVSQSTDFRLALNNPTRSFTADLEALRDEIDGDRLWLKKEGLEVQISTCGGVDYDLFARLGDIPGRAALTRLAEALASHPQPDVPWTGELTVHAAFVGLARQVQAIDRGPGR